MHRETPRGDRERVTEERSEDEQTLQKERKQTFYLHTQTHTSISACSS
jgi:hypothetical protein